MGNLTGYIVGGAQLVAGAILTLTGISAGIGIPLMIAGATTIGGTALAPRPAGGRGGFDRSSTYGFDSISNDAFEGSPQWFILGKHEVAPTYLSAFTEQTGKTQKLKALLYCGSGGDYGIASISEIKLNDQPIDHFEDVTTTTRPGTAGQLVIKGFEKVSTPFPDGTTFDDGDVWTYTTHTEVDEVALPFAWLQGLFGIKGSGSRAGSIEQTGWRVLVQYRNEGDTEWASIDPPKNDDTWKRKGGGEWKILGKTQAVKRAVMRISWTTSAVRTLRLTAKNGNASGDFRNPTLQRVEEVVNDNRAYAGSALLAIEAVATAALSGGLPKITCVIEGWKVKNLGDSTAAFTRNPAKLRHAFLTNVEDGCGRWVSASDLDDGVGGTWRAAETHYNQLASSTPGSDHLQARHQLDLVVDSIQPAAEWLEHIDRLTRSVMVEWGGLIRLIVDKASSSIATFDGRVSRSSANRPILMLNDGRADIVEREIPVDERTTHAKAAYWDREDNYARRWTDEIVDPDFVAGDPRVYKELYLPGVTRQAEALRQARYQIQTSRFRTKVWEIGVGIGDLNLLPMDQITVLADSPPLASQTMMVLGTGYGEDHSGRLICTQYDANVYTDTSDTLTPKALSLSRADALKTKGQVASGASSLKIVVGS